MHKYLRAVGFSGYKKRADIKDLLARALRADGECSVYQLPDGTASAQIFIETAEGLGLCICGELNDDDEFETDFYFPFIKSSQESTSAECRVYRHAERESYSGMCDEYKVGASLIFQLINANDYLIDSTGRHRNSRHSKVMLSGLAAQGVVLLPIKKTEKQRELVRTAEKKRTALMEAASQGDAEAIDSLTLEEMILYSSISEHMRCDDIYTIVDSTFLPYGVESDQYSILGEICEAEKVINSWTNEEICVLMVECNDLMIRVGINSKDLLGEPLAGRRFKGRIWLQGCISLEDQ